MAQDTQVVEKRVKSTIIRRRKEVVPEAAPAASEEQASPSSAQASSPETSGAQAESSQSVSASTPSTQAAPGSTGPSQVGSTQTAPGQTAPQGKTESAEPAQKKPVPFGVPIRTIPLSQLRPQTKTSAAAAKPAEASKVGSVPVPLEEIVEEDDDKKLKPKKVIKKKEGELEVDLEGVGKVSTITQLTRLVHVDRIERVFQPSRLPKRKKVISKKGMKSTPLTITKAAKRVVEMGQAIRVADLAHGMGVKSNAVIAKLMAMGTMATINTDIDFDTASLIAHEFQYEVKNISFNEADVLKTEEVTEEGLLPRAPVVTVMGHVDHGKTSLLDAIRSANVAEGEAGGITQHIGAYTVSLPKSSKAQGKITFLDTPGHEAFTAMRARGAKATDIVILVVAADDGLMPQTIESIDHAKAAGVPIVVAINKIDKPEANPDKVKRQLSEHGLVPEEWGGETQCAPVSAKQKTGIEDLLEKVLLQAEVLELKANPNMKARGVVLEARMDKFRGAVATVLVQQGTLKMGDVVVAGAAWGRVRAMTNYKGENVPETLPSEAVEILGLCAVPQASDTFHVVADEQAARDITEHRQDQMRDEKLGKGQVSLEDIFSKVQKGEAKELAVVLKTDVHGSLEAVSEALKKLSTEKVSLRLIHGAVGGITESDVLLSSASGAIIIGFNVRPETTAIKVAANEGVDIKLYKIIYDMVNDVKLAMQGLLAPTRKENYLGRAEVRQTFTVSKIGTVAGCMVVDGKINRASELRLLRDNVVIHEGKISSLKRFKDDAREVTEGMECGLGIEGYSDIKPGDVLEAFQIELIKTEL